MKFAPICIYILQYYNTNTTTNNNNINYNTNTYNTTTNTYNTTNNRLVSTGVYLFFMGLTLFLAFYKEDIPARVLWLVVSIICQFFALAWYTLSFIPFARDIVKGFLRDWCLKDCCSTAPADEDLWFT